ncbi:MAG TPA: CrcB family protein [Bryobacteraceae bacterium]|jgi:CrcB protein
MMRYLCVMAGGALGSLLRYVAGLAIMSRWGGSFPMGTFVINVTGSFAIGVLSTLLAGAVNPLWRPLLIVGVLGGYTTFSSFEWEAFANTRGGAGGLALLYVLGSVLFGYIACWLGATAAGLWNRP